MKGKTINPLTANLSTGGAVNGLGFPSSEFQRMKTDFNRRAVDVNAWPSYYHPVLYPMRGTCDRWIDTGEPRGWDVLVVLAILNVKPSFHRHFATHEAEVLP